MLLSKEGDCVHINPADAAPMFADATILPNLLK